MIWWQYLILANVYLLLFYGFYAVLLRKETFFQLNRLYLLVSAVLSFLVPLVQADWARNLFITQRLTQTIYQLGPVTVYQVQRVQTHHYTIGQILALIYLAGIIVLTLRFTLQLVLLRRGLKDDTDDTYAFFKTIKLNKKQANHGIIMAHEEAHARQWHSADVLMIEAVMIMNWFNPAVYLYRNAIKHIHEFIADRNALKSGTSKQAYALLLLSETFKTPAHHLVNPFFNHSLLKQRILMLQKSNSQRTALLKYGLSAPLFALMVILSSATVNTHQAITDLSDRVKEITIMPLTSSLKAESNNTLSPSLLKGIVVPLIPDANDFKPQARQVPAGTLKKDTDVIFLSVDKSAEFPGGLSEFGRYIAQNVRLADAVENGEVPERVILSFVVEKNGSLSNIHPLTEKNSLAAKEAMRVLAASPKWIPGKQNGRNVRMKYVAPINFRTTATERFSFVADTSGKGTGASAFHTGLGKTTVVTTPKDTSKSILLTYRRRANELNELAPLYYIDGKLATQIQLQSISSEKIKSISVYKGAAAAEKYGPLVKNDVIDVITLPNKPEKQ